MEVNLTSDEESGTLRERLLPTEATKDPDLPLSLRLLYGLNGVTLSLPITALLYIVNTRALVPVEYLSAFGAVAFLPCSLKPFYACLSQFVPRRNALLVLLLVASGVFTSVTALIPHGGVFLCFILAFCRGVTSSWPEFLLGLCLIQEASKSQSYSLAAARLQAQAATARNFGSFVATIAAFLVFVLHRELNDKVVMILLVTTGVLNLLAAVIACWFRVGDSLSDSVSREDINNDVLASDERTRPSLGGSLCTGNGLVVVIFQLCIIVFAMQGPLESISSELAWSILVLLLIVALACLVWRSYPVKWQHIHRVGLVLIARHALPDSSYIMGSFIYSQLQSTPVILQGISIVTMGVTTLSSWSFGKLFANFNQGFALILLIAGTTICSSLLSLDNLLVVKVGHDDDENTRHWTFYLLVLLASAVTSFAGEWAFLPDVVLATATVGKYEELAETMHTEFESDASASEEEETVSTPLMREEAECQQEATGDYCSSSGVLYGTLISCIDFGDQIGAWVTVPLVSALGISRENDWTGLNEMIVLTAAIGVLSVLWLGIINNERR